MVALRNLFGISPDITCLGKIIGGGLPVGAYGGSSDLMRNIAPAGSIYQAGTLSGNPLAMTAGLLTLRRLRNKNIYAQLEDRTAQLCDGLSAVAEAAGIKTTTNRVGSMWTTFFSGGPIVDWATANRSDRELFGRFFHGMLDSGVYLAPSQFEAGFVSIAHTEEVIEQTIAAARKAFQALEESSLIRLKVGKRIALAQRQKFSSSTFRAVVLSHAFPTEVCLTCLSYLLE